MSEHPSGSALRSVSARAERPGPILTLAPDPEARRIGTGFAGIDRVLGGGLVPGSVVLLAGAPGIGKSTLLLQLGSHLTVTGHPCVLASGEEARSQVAARARRLGVDGDRIGFVAGRELSQVLAAGEAGHPEVLIVDSIHTIRDSGSEALPGGVGQVRACADALIGLAKDQGITVVLIGHVTKGGELAGPRTLEHAVDVVLSFEGDPRTGRRILSAHKNRFGAEGEVGWFEMTAAGLVEADAGPRLGEGGTEPGCATALAAAGRRAFAVDVEVLVVSSEMGPRRQAVGLEPRRFAVVSAVADRIGRLGLGRAEVFGASSGGLRLEDPGTDLAVAVALASSVRGVAPRPAAYVGELSLTGGIRPVPGMEQRLKAARAAGLDVVVAPEGSASGSGPERSTVVPVRHLREALAWAMGGSGQRRGRSSGPNPGPRPTVERPKRSWGLEGGEAQTGSRTQARAAEA